MDNALAKQISNHLEFLGYEIEDKSTADECSFTATTSDRNPNLFVDVNKDNLVMIRTFWGPCNRGQVPGLNEGSDSKRHTA